MMPLNNQFAQFEVAPRFSSARSGFTLLEVLLATAILLGAIAALGQLATHGRTAALRTQFETEAALLCDSIMAEIVASARPLTFDRDQPIDGRPDWTWRARETTGPTDALRSVSVTVVHAGTATTGVEFRIDRLLPTATTNRSTFGATR